MEFLSTFEVPAFARPLIGALVVPEEVLLVSGVRSREFSKSDARAALEATTGDAWPEQRLEPLLRDAYRRGVLELVDESFEHFRVATFYDRLGVFVIAQADEYRALPPETRAALDAWFFDEYASRLDDTQTPTGDRVLPLELALLHVEQADQPIWLNPCDCRTLAGSCELPVETCVTFRNGINTLAHRGWSKPLTKEEAKAVIRRADADGLMHTVNEGGVCNCCSDCCYLFRAQAMRGSGPAWPVAEQIAMFDVDECIACGRCVERCPFDAFDMAASQVVYDQSRCRGCGLCAQTCPTSAIAMRPRGEAWSRPGEAAPATFGDKVVS